MPVVTGTEWLIIREVSGSPLVAMDVNRSTYLHFGNSASGLGGSERTSYGHVLAQRAQANIALSVKSGDDYIPVDGWQVFLYEINSATSAQECVFCGLIDKVQTSWWGTSGDRLIALSCVSFEKVFDVIRVPGRLYKQQTAGAIFTDLLDLASGWPGTIGTIEDGLVVDTLLIEGEPTIASIFDKLATLCLFIWGVDPTNLEINFTPPGLIAAPFDLHQTDPLWEELSYISDEHDFRDRQEMSTDFNQFAESIEEFTGDNSSTGFTLRNPVHTVNAAFITRNTQNTATGTMSGQPAAGDTVSVGYPTTGSAFNWAPNSPYAVGYMIIDPANHRQIVTAVSGISPSGSTFGQSGSSEPTWNDVGGTTQDNGLTWQDFGLLGLGPNLAAIYTFVTTLDNTQYGQVLIGGSAAATLQNLIDAINSTTAVRGITYSLPTWENSLCNADAPSGTTFTIRNKNPGRGNIASLASTGSSFAWSATLTSGGITTFNTVSLGVGVNSPGARSTGLSYNPGSAVVNLPSPLNIGTYLSVSYYRIDGNIIGVEDTPLVAQRAEIESGTGKYQALTSAPTASTPEQTLAFAQAALAAFKIIPQNLEFITLHPGLRVGMSISVDFTLPDGPDIRVP